MMLAIMVALFFVVVAEANVTQPHPNIQKYISAKMSAKKGFGYATVLRTPYS
jgi:hypothetical protein